MTEQWTTTIHDASELPPKEENSETSDTVIAYLEDETYEEAEYCYECVGWYNSANHAEKLPVLRWFEKPPVQKKKEKREIGVDVYRSINNDYIVMGNFDSPLNPDRYKKVHTTTIKFED